jgi:glycerophosphoryl diester phosphodiesterase
MEYTGDTFYGTKVMILGHRGMGMNYHLPGNTLHSIAAAIAIGADGCEVDIQLTKDTVPVLFHNTVLDSRTTCSGRIYEMNWADLQQCQYNAVQSGIRILSVDTMFNKLTNLGNLYFSFDCTKLDPEATDQDLYQSQFLRAIKRVCEKYNMSDHVFIEGTGTLLTRAQQLGLTNKLFLFDPPDSNTIKAADSCGFFGISASMDWLTGNTEFAHSKGLYIMVWSPNNDSQNKIALKNNVDIIQTDDPISILKLLKRYNYEYVIP